MKKKYIRYDIYYILDMLQTSYRILISYNPIKYFVISIIVIPPFAQLTIADISSF